MFFLVFCFLFIFKIICITENVIGSSLKTLSIGGCSQSASDIAPLCEAIKKGFQLQMLKLSANRLEDEGVTVLSQALIGCKTHPLAVLDLSSNTVSYVRLIKQ